jgi:hypothetical protein
MQAAIDSVEFSEWLWADARGELPDAYDTFGMVAAAAMNSGMRYPKKPVVADDFRPKFTTAAKEQEKQVKAFERMTAKTDYSTYIWQT